MLQALVEGSLSPGTFCAPENYAGDPDVKQFIDGFCASRPELNLQVWVHWGDKPSVSILKMANQNLLLRSERFDILLVEFFKLVQLGSTVSQPSHIEQFVRSAVSKWFCEFLIGLNGVRPALRSFERHRTQELVFPHHTFRDEALASVHRVPKAALQCFCLAHEIAHAIFPRREGMNLDFDCDGLDLRTHLTWEMRQMNIDQRIIEASLLEIEPDLDADLLVTEVDADLSALGTIARYLPQVFGVPRADGFRFALIALQAQSYINHIRNTCNLLLTHLRNGLSKERFTQLDLIQSHYISVRTRCAMRRAGILWYLWDREDGIEDDINSYPARVDKFFIDFQSLLQLISAASFDEAEVLFDEISILRAGLSSMKTLDEELHHFVNDADTRMAMFNILISMGYPGGILGNINAVLKQREDRGAQRW